MEHKDRDKWERKFARAYRKNGDDFKEELRKIIRSSGGWPAGVDAIPFTKWAEYEGNLNELFDPLVYNVFLTSARRLAKDVGADFAWEIANERAAAYARTYTYELVKDITTTDMRLLQGAFDQYYRQGMSLEEVSEVIEMSPAFGPARAELIAITEVTRTSVAGEWDQVQTLVDQGWDLVPVWNTRYDEFVCGDCGPRHDHAQGDGWEEAPPAHPRCRCWLNYMPKNEVPQPEPVVEPAPIGEQLPLPGFEMPPPLPGVYPRPETWKEIGIDEYAKRLLPDTKIVYEPMMLSSVHYEDVIAEELYKLRMGGKVDHCLPKVFKMGVSKDFRRVPGASAWANGDLVVSTNPIADWSPEIARRMVTEKFWSTQEVLTHEFGHIGHYKMQQTMGFAIPDMKNLTKVEKIVANKVSEYACKNAWEFIAETFNGLIGGIDYPTSVLNMYKRYGGPEVEGAIKYTKDEIADLRKRFPKR